ncbi:MAG: DNA mismatch repair endonuclease MutL [Candidatus Eisenbacteria bacterium]|nr:DNA mismatch repair endonuclease MutL [Candidatus Eisenbacteria bacterium]
MLRPIRRLPESTASRIAAGEVIERPLSALKEVLENALDAGGRRIEVRVEGSLDRGFVVADDGAGIAPAELELALERHATSKLGTIEDLDRLATLGFRGEALPSIAAVSRLRLVSRLPDAEAAAFVEVEGGRVTGRGAIARSPGTTVEVRDLFFNTPARRKFLNTAGGELRAALRMIEGYALARPDVGLRMLVDGKERFEWGAVGSRRERAAQIWGARHAEQLVEAHGERAGVSVYALLGLPEHARSTREGQVFLVNGRWIQNAALSQALRHAYGNLLPGGRFPGAILWVEVPAERLDVNVHPTKREVRFADDDAVFSLVAATCAQPLSKLYPPFTVVAGRGSETPQPAWAERVRETPPADESQLGLGLPAGEAAAAAAASANGPAAAGAPEPELWQLHRTYILAPVRGGLVIIDQHAAHERILYELARAKLEGREGAAQRLLFPALVDLTHAQFEMLLESGEQLRLLGWDLSPLGPPSVVIQGVPAGLRIEHPGLLLQDLLDGVADGALPHQHHGGPALAQDDLIERLARSHACHAAIKAGDPLSVEDMRSLVDQLFATERPHGDPHGRPTFVRMELEDLHRRFGRS